MILFIVVTTASARMGKQYYLQKSYSVLLPCSWRSSTNPIYRAHYCSRTAPGLRDWQAATSVHISNVHILNTVLSPKNRTVAFLFKMPQFGYPDYINIYLKSFLI